MKLAVIKYNYGSSDRFIRNIDDAGNMYTGTYADVVYDFMRQEKVHCIIEEDHKEIIVLQEYTKESLKDELIMYKVLGTTERQLATLVDILENSADFSVDELLEVL